MVPVEIETLQDAFRVLEILANAECKLASDAIDTKRSKQTKGKSFILRPLFALKLLSICHISKQSNRNQEKNFTLNRKDSLW